jgi:hypothetical protein
LIKLIEASDDENLADLKPQKTKRIVSHSKRSVLKLNESIHQNLVKSQTELQSQAKPVENPEA